MFDFTTMSREKELSNLVSCILDKTGYSRSMIEIRKHNFRKMIENEQIDQSEYKAVLSGSSAEGLNICIESDFDCIVILNLDTCLEDLTLNMETKGCSPGYCLFFMQPRLRNQRTELPLPNLDAKVSFSGKQLMELLRGKIPPEKYQVIEGINGPAFTYCFSDFLNADIVPSIPFCGLDILHEMGRATTHLRLALGRA